MKAKTNGGTINITFNRPFVYPYQRKFMDNPERFTVTEASTKVGKTAGCIIWLLEEALRPKFRGAKFWWVAPIYAQAQIAFDRMRLQVSYEGFFKANLAKLTLETPNGSIIEFKSADKPDSLFGEDVYACVFDEFTRAKEAAWTAIRTTLSSTNGKCKFIGNVRGRGWGYKLAQRAKNGGNPHYAYNKITCWDAVCTGYLSPDTVRVYREMILEGGKRKDVYQRLLSWANYSVTQTWSKKPRLTLEEVLSAKSDLAEHNFAELYEAEPSNDGGNPFGVQFLDRQAVDGLSTLPSVAYGVDLAKSVDFTVFCGLDSNNRVSHLNRFQLDWGLTSTAIDELPDMPTDIDQTGVGNPIVEQAQKRKQNIEGFTFTSTSKQQLIENLAAAIRTGVITFPANTPLADELYSFEYIHTPNGVRYSAPTGLHDDCVIALALAYRASRRKILAPHHEVSVPKARKGVF